MGTRRRSPRPHPRGSAKAARYRRPGRHEGPLVEATTLCACDCHGAHLGELSEDEVPGYRIGDVQDSGGMEIVLCSGCALKLLARLMELEVG